jgi:drug/metabolite transporter (DMT)-like permease
LLALLCAFLTNLGFLFKHRGACAAPDVEWKHPLRSAKNLWTSKWFAIGMGVAIGAWTFHVAAMALAPLSLVQAVISGGLVFLAVLADRVFGFNVGTRQWVGVCMTALGLAVTIVASIVAFYASASGLQKAEAVPVIALTSAAANVSAIAGGIIVFGDPMPADALGIVLQSLAFLMVIVASALTPGPMRAAESTN